MPHVLGRGSCVPGSLTRRGSCVSGSWAGKGSCVPGSWAGKGAVYQVQGGEHATRVSRLLRKSSQKDLMRAEGVCDEYLGGRGRFPSFNP